MTRKDYILIAAALKAAKIPTLGTIRYREQHDAIAIELANVLGGDNPRFDRQRFLVACGVQS